MILHVGFLVWGWGFDPFVKAFTANVWFLFSILCFHVGVTFLPARSWPLKSQIVFLAIPLITCIPFLKLTKATIHLSEIFPFTSMFNAAKTTKNEHRPENGSISILREQKRQRVCQTVFLDVRKSFLAPAWNLQAFLKSAEKVKWNQSINQF